MENAPRDSSEDVLATSQHYLLQDHGSQPEERHPHSPSQSHSDAAGSHRSLTTWNAFSLLVLTQIGAGLFASPSRVDSNVASPGVALVVWMFSALLAWTGAASFADLAALFPDGGMEEYLARFYGETVSSLMEWTWLTIVKPSSMAMVSTVMIESVFTGFATTPVPWIKKLITMLAFITVVALNLHSTRASTRVATAFLAIKLTAVGIIICGGLFAVTQFHHASARHDDWISRSWFKSRSSVVGGTTIDWTQIGWWETIGHLCTAVYAVLWACTGWDNASFIARDMNQPSNDLPRAIHSAMLLVTTCYQLVNISFYVLVPWDTFGSSDLVAVTAARRLGGPALAIVIAALVALVAAGTVSANVFIISRLTVTASHKGHIPTIFARNISGEQRDSFIQRTKELLVHPFTTSIRSRSPQYRPIAGQESSESALARSSRDIAASKSNDGVPLLAIGLNFFLTSIYVFMGSFRVLITFNGSAVYTFYFLTLLGLFWYRIRDFRAAKDNGVKKYSRVAAPAVFCLASLAVLLRTLIFLPAQAATLACLLLIGVLVHKYRQRNRAGR